MRDGFVADDLDIDDASLGATNPSEVVVDIVVIQHPRGEARSKCADCAASGAHIVEVKSVPTSAIWMGIDDRSPRVSGL